MLLVWELKPNASLEQPLSVELIVFMTLIIV